MRRKLLINRKKLIVIYDNFVFLFLFLIIFALPEGSYYTHEELSRGVFPWICFLLVLQIYNFIVMDISKYDFMLWYSLLSYIFMFGYVFRDIFELNTLLLWNPITLYSPKILYKTYIYVVIALQLIVLGYLLPYQGQKPIFDMSSDDINITELNIGIWLIIVGGVSRLITDVSIILIVQVANTYSAYADAVGAGLFDDLGTLFLPGIALIIYSNVPNKRVKMFLFYITIAYLTVVMVLTGTRKTQTFEVLTLLLIFLSQRGEKKINPLNYIFVFLLGFLIINIVIVLRDSRYNLASFFNEFSGYITRGFVYGIFGEILAETSLTVLSVASIIQLVPSVVGFQYGMTIIRTIPSILPIGWLVGDFFQKASSTNMINKKIGIPTGSSIIGELYWNWGMVGGWILVLLFGVFLSLLFRWICKNETKYSKAIYFSVFSQLIILVRASIFDVFRPVIYTIIAIFLLDGFYNRGIRT